jgi:bacterioferritin-associated ferredoxin
MYVCLCHAISDREIRACCAASPSCSVSQIYRSQGVAPKCGKCVGTVRALIAEARKVAENASTVLDFAPA